MDNNRTIKSYECKHTLWQALGGTSINMHRSIDKAIIVNLIANGYVVAGETVRFKTYKARNEAFDRACKTGTLAMIAGTTVK